MQFQLFTLAVCIFLLFSCKHNVEKPIADESKIAIDGNVNYSKANDFLARGMNDSSFTYFDLASDNFIEAGDSLHAATCFIQMAITLFEEGDYYAAQETSLEADKLLDSSNNAHRALMAFNYNNLGNAISGYGDNAEALAYYDLAIKYAVDALDAKTYNNNKAVTMFAANNYKGAYLIHKKNLDVGNKGDNDYARILSNYANTRWRIDKNYNPLPDLHQALNIRLKSADDYGLNSSYAHLFDYHYGRNADSAKMYALMCFTTANKINVSADRINAAEKLIKVSDADSSKYYFQIYKRLDDSVRAARLKARNQYALIRYESEKNKINNLKLQKDVLDRDLRISKERIVMVIVFGVVLSGLLYYILWARKRKQRMRMELENKVKEIQLTTSKKVHDVVANGIYRVMTELEYKDNYDKQDLLDKLEYMYEKSRDISYEPSKDVSLSSFVSDVSTLLGSFANERVRIIIVGNDPQIWNRVPQNAKDDLLIIFQELLVNMRKHSLADEVIFRFEATYNKLNIFYQDNGIGFSSVKKEGNGLRNTGTRMERLGGKFNFVSEDGKGLKIEIILPLPQNKPAHV